MSSLYAKYLKEREGFSIIEDEKGFATYLITGEECYVRDAYVLPQFRDEHVASGYTDQIAKIAKDQGCKFLTGTVYTKANGASKSLMAIMKYGFSIHASDQQKIILIKEL